MSEPRIISEPLAASDGREIPVRVITPAMLEPVGVIQVLHGLGEHHGRYLRFATAAAARGLAVVAHDHRGHGESAKTLGYFGDDDGWQKLLDDALLVNEHAHARFGALPLTLLGHSMGSFLAQHFAMLYGTQISALLLSGSTWSSRTQLVAANLLAREECLRVGASNHSPLLDKLGIGNFNKAFAPARTEFDWLSRDETEVDAYIADPLCGKSYTAGLWRDLTGGLLAITSDDALGRIAADLPIMISGGSDDPLGGDKGLGRLALHYAQTGHQRLTVKVYDGGRHEMLNEINRDKVTADWLDWVGKVSV